MLKNIWSDDSSKYRKIQLGGVSSTAQILVFNTNTNNIYCKSYSNFIAKNEALLGSYRLTQSNGAYKSFVNGWFVFPFTIDGIYPNQNIGVEDTSIEGYYGKAKMAQMLSVLRKGKTISVNNVVTPLSFLWFSDLHANSNGLKRMTDFYRDNNWYFTGGILSTGDSVNDKYQDDFAFWVENGGDIVKNVIGNHDANWSDGTTRTATQKECYDKFFAPYIANWGVVQPDDAESVGKCYYYKDYADQKIRLVVVDELHFKGEGDNLVDGVNLQKTWLQQILSDAKEKNYAVVIAAHASPMTDITVLNCNYTSMDGKGISISTGGHLPLVVQQFIDDGGEFICYLVGHSHFDYCGHLTTYPTQFVITTVTAKSGDSKDQDVIRTGKGVDNFTAISFNPTSKTITMFRIGADRDNYGRYKGVLCWSWGENKLLYDE